MSRYWVIAPFHAGDPEVWDAIWQYHLAHSTISIGWRALGDVSHLDEESIFDLMHKQWPEMTTGAARNSARMLYKFYHSISPGDIIIARRGRKEISGIGTVTRTAWYDPDLLIPVFRPFGPDYEVGTYPHHVQVQWKSDADSRDIVYEEQVFGLTTLYELPIEKFRELMEAEEESASPAESDVTLSPCAQSEFVLEKYLEDFIVSNFEIVFKGRLAIFSEPEEGPVGQQFQTDVGVIDILAQDIANGDLVVIELKRGRPADKVVGQILKYMGWVAENLCGKGQNVRGLIICHDHDPKLGYALKLVNNVSVNYYQIDFTLSEQPSSEP